MRSPFDRRPDRDLDGLHVVGDDARRDHLRPARVEDGGEEGSRGVLRLAPPLVLTDAQVDAFVAALPAALDAALETQP